MVAGAENSAPTGPFLTAALICERVLEEKDGVLSVVRIIDQLTHTIIGPSLPAELPVVPYDLTFLITFKAGRARGRHDLTLMMEDPSGDKRQVISQSVQMEGENRGTNLVLKGKIEFKLEGLYWFDVLLENRLITRMPFKLMYQLVSTGTQ
jgi:hypothetical protein